MQSDFIRSSLICTTLLLFCCSGCTSLSSQFSWLGSLDMMSESSATADQDPDLEPVAVESEICLDQELEALALTGEWELPDPGQTLQTVVDDSVEPEIYYDFPVVMNRQVEMYLDLFQGKQRRYFQRWLARSGRYMPMIHKELSEAGLPQDLVYLAMIESGFNQRAYSRSHAVGLWQFMKGTGRDYGLRVDSYIDERRDAVKATRAAVAYLKNLYGEFGDWHLAVAAYNGGPGTIRRAIRRTGTNDFWKIAQKRTLRLETKRYVPKLIAAIIIAKEPEAYGFTNIAYESPLAFDTITVGPGLSLKAAALLTDSSPKEIKELNLELKTGKTPLNRERYELKIPDGTRSLALKNMPRLHSVASTDYKTHIVRKGETLARICKRYNVNTTTLLKVNNLKSGTLNSGARLRIPYTTVHYRILPEGMDAAVAARDELVLHTVRKGETVSKISKQYRVPVELIVSWNGLSSIHKITAGQQLALYLNNGDTPKARKKYLNGEVVALKKGQKSAPQSLLEQESYQWYLVKSGDSLWTISRRFNTSPEEIMKWNNLKSNLIHPGSRLKLKDV